MEFESSAPFISKQHQKHLYYENKQINPRNENEDRSNCFIQFYFINDFLRLWS